MGKGDTQAWVAGTKWFVWLLSRSSLGFSCCLQGNLYMEEIGFLWSQQLSNLTVHGRLLRDTSGTVGPASDTEVAKSAGILEDTGK